MSVNFTSETLNQQLDGLNLDDAKNVNRVMSNRPSLLSSSLAKERLKYPHSNFGAGEETTATTTTTMTDHPEPELLATSVGKDSEGRLIPSSSTISLLSLNTANQQETSPQLNQYQFDDSHINRVSGIRSRNSITHLNQKRFETYAKITSPGPTEIDHSTSQSIPINNKFIPDSPNLDPTSLTGSPSRFWLSSQTPPRSMNNSYKKSAMYQLPQYQLHQQQIQHHQVQTQAQSQSHTQIQHNQAQAHPQQQVHPQAHPHALQPPVPPMSIPLNRKGSDSPTLNPVQTPQEEMPMTPLYLNEFHKGYFNTGHIDEANELLDS